MPKTEGSGLPTERIENLRASSPTCQIHDVRVSSLAEFVEAAVTLTDREPTYWFRGLSDASYALTPSVLRYDSEKERTRALRSIDDFKRIALTKLALGSRSGLYSWCSWRPTDMFFKRTLCPASGPYCAALSSRGVRSLRDRLEPVEAELAVVSAFHQRAASLESHLIALKSVHRIVSAAGKQVSNGCMVFKVIACPFAVHDMRDDLARVPA